MDLKNKELSAFSINLKKYIRLSGMTNKELAEKMGVTPSTITAYVNGVAFPRMDKVNKLCEIFNISKSDLLEDETPNYCITDMPPNYILKESTTTYNNNNDNTYFKQLIDSISNLYKNGSLSVSSIIDLNVVVNSFLQLNSMGQAELAKRSNEMTEISKFKK